MWPLRDKALEAYSRLGQFGYPLTKLALKPFQTFHFVFLRWETFSSLKYSALKGIVLMFSEELVWKGYDQSMSYLYVALWTAPVGRKSSTLTVRRVKCWSERCKEQSGSLPSLNSLKMFIQTLFHKHCQFYFIPAELLCASRHIFECILIIPNRFHRTSPQMT